MLNKFYITTPIYYVNAEPHIGHSYTTLAADILARFHRLSGDDVFFLTGTDEHGAKIEEKARQNQKEPQEFVDEISSKFQSFWKELAISNDYFIRTTDTRHIHIVQNDLRYMHEKGDIYLGKYEGLYCKGCEQYLSEKDLVGGLCPDHKTAPEKVKEESYMFRLSKYQDQIFQKIKNKELKILPEEKEKEVFSFYEKEGLKDISFSRKNVSWGIPLPWDETHTVYVWADAFLNYLTGLRIGGEQKEKYMWPADLQLMSKDILRVHATIWPAMLLSLDVELPKEFYIHGFFQVDGQKMSKSLGNVISPADMIKKYGVAGARYLLISALSYGHDADINWNWLDEKYNADLANGLGNLIARVSNLLEKNNISIDLHGLNTDEHGLINDVGGKLGEYRFDEALKIIWTKIKECDERLTAKAPWKMDDQGEIKKVLEPIAQDILNIGYVLRPFLPETAEKIIKQFSETQVKKGESLFPRI